ncbi:MAG: Fic family protein [Chloroflexota bacterium]
MPRWNVHFDLHIDFANIEMVRLVERAHALSAVIRAIPIPPYLQMELDTVNILRAVRGTTSIEGAEVSTKEVRMIMDSPGKRILPASRGKDEQEVRNAQTAMYFIAKLVRQQPDAPLTEGLICEFHRLMTQDIPYEHNVPGQYRNHPVRAEDYLPPETGEEVRILVQQFVEWFRSPSVVHWDPIIRAVAAHFYLVSIHPFGDGNGRTSRAVESFLLYQGKVNARGFYSLANYYYQNRAEYVRQLDNARFNGKGDLTPFIMFALHGLITELQEVHEDVLKEVKVISFRDYAREEFLTQELLSTKAGLRSFTLLMGMGKVPIPMTGIYTLALYKDVTRRTVQRDIRLLRTHKLVIIKDGMLTPNLDVMNQFTAIEELEKGIPEDLEEEELEY